MKETQTSANRNPAISVIVPTYNRASLVVCAIQSIREQTYQNFEIIVVDDGSTDNTKEVVESLGDMRIRYISHERNKGGSAARNTGIKAARGKYIAFLDSDDEWEPSKIERQLEIFSKGDARLGAVGAGRIIKFTNSNRKEIKIPSGSLGNIYKKLLQGKSFPGATSTIIIKRECFEKVGLFDESLESSQEYDLYIRIAKYYNFDAVREALVRCYIYAFPGISLNPNAQVRGRQKMLLKYSQEMPTLSKLKAQFYFTIGINLCRSKKVEEGRKYLLNALVAFPLTIKYWVNFFFSLFPCYEYLMFKRTWLSKRIRK